MKSKYLRMAENEKKKNKKKKKKWPVHLLKYILKSYCLTF